MMRMSNTTGTGRHLAKQRWPFVRFVRRGGGKCAGHQSVRLHVRVSSAMS
jgi:hypothetical protein